MKSLQQQNRSQVQSQKQQNQKPQNQTQQPRVVDDNKVAQALVQRTQELNSQNIYKQIINEEKKVYGKKYPQRNTEPSMFDILSWDQNKQQMRDFKSNHIPINEVDQYKVLINKSATNFQSEQRDNYRQYYLDKEEGILVPEVEPEVIERLREKQQAIQLLNHHSTTKNQPIALTSQQQQNQQHDSYHVDHVGIKSNYQREYDIDDIHNENELIDMIQKNYSHNQKQSQALLEKAQQKKRSKVQINNFYEVPEVPKYHSDEEYKQEQVGDLTEIERQKQIEREHRRQLRQQEEYERNEAAKVKKFSSVNTKNVKSKLIKYKPQAVKLDPQYQKERISRRKERIEHMEETTRWLPNSAFTTYFGKPAFENYGRGNVNPSIGGCIYGQYLLSHNVNPHRGIHQPRFIQSYNNALNFGERLPDSEPLPPRNVQEDFRLSQNQVVELKNRNPLTATRNNRENLRIQKPDLINSLRFASNENSPVNVANDEEEKRRRIKNELKELREGTKAHTKSATQFMDFPSSQPQKNQQQSQQTQNGQQRPQTASQKQVKIQGDKGQQLPNHSQYQPIQLTEEQIRANQEWADDLPHKQIMDELNRKKAKKNRLALKVTEVIPVLPKKDEKEINLAGVKSENKNKSLSPERPSRSQPKYDTEQINLSGLPEQVQNELKEKLNNPRLYKNAPSQYTKHIPYAGKALSQADDIKSVFSYQGISYGNDRNY